MADPFGISGPVKALVPPSDYEDVHADGMSWARQGTNWQSTTRIGAADWNALIANLRGLLTIAGVDLSDLPDDSPLFLREALTRSIAAGFPAAIADNDDAIAAALAANAAFIAAMSLVAPFSASALTTGTLAEARLPFPFSANGKSLVAAANYAAMRTLLSVYSATETDSAISAAVAALVNSAPAALNTLVELATALGNDANFASTMTTALAGKVALAGATLTGGFMGPQVADGTKSSGTYTPDPTTANWRTCTNGGAFTLAAPTTAGNYSMLVEMTNNASAGAVTLSGFTKTDGDAFTTTNGHVFWCWITRCNTRSHIQVRRMI